MKMSIAKDNSGEPEASGNADPGEIPPSKEELRLEEAWKALLARRRAKREQDAGNDPVVLTIRPAIKLPAVVPYSNCPVNRLSTMTWNHSAGSPGSTRGVITPPPDQSGGRTG